MKEGWIWGLGYNSGIRTHTFTHLSLRLLSQPNPIANKNYQFIKTIYLKFNANKLETSIQNQIPTGLNVRIKLKNSSNCSKHIFDINLINLFVKSVSFKPFKL